MRWLLRLAPRGRCLAAFAAAFAAASAGAQTVEWASRVVAFSSQFSPLKHSAQQALGKPTCMPQGGDLPGAWAAEGVREPGDTSSAIEESTAPQFLALGYATPLHIRQIAIGENNAPGAIDRVTIYDEDDSPHVVYAAVPAPVEERERMLNIFLPLTSFAVDHLRIDIMPDSVPGWNEIDAVAISDDVDTIRAEINFVPNMPHGLGRRNLGEHINTQYNDFGPVITPDGKTLFFIRTRCPQNVGGESAGSDIYTSTMQDDGTWSYAENIGPPLNNTGHNSIESVAPDGNTALLTNEYNPDGSARGGGMSMAHRTATGWSVPTNISIDEYYNRSSFSESCLSPDGKAIVKTFERDDTHGQRDLYVCFFKPDGSCAAPRNLGPDVNTAGNEAAPFLAADGVTLYFASDGRSGFGDFDLYVTRRLDSTWRHWSEPQNLGPDINSADFDAYYTVSASGDYAYFSSNRDSYGGQDIVRIALPQVARPKPVVLVTGRVFDESTMKPVEAHIIYEDLANGKESGRARSNPADGRYGISLPAGTQYGFRAEAQGFYSISDNLDTRTLEHYGELKKDLFLAPIEVGQAIRLNNIFFDFGKATLQPESSPELQRAASFLKENANVQIEIDGYTDSIGTDAANRALSQSRADAVAAAIITQGIAATRITAKGWGKGNAIASNDTEEGRKQNRRVEFTIVKR